MGMIDEALAQIRKPLAQLVEERLRPQYGNSMSTAGFTNKQGNGISANTWGDLQVGGNGALVACSPEESFISMEAEESQVHGHLRVFSNSSGKALEINTGEINPRLVPPQATPLTLPPGKTFAPPLAVMTVASLTSVTPSNSVLVDITWDPPAGMPGPEGIPAVPFVYIPTHKHTVQVNPQTGTGTTTGITSWTGEPGTHCPVPLHGVAYEYLFGYNRMHEIVSKSL